MKTIKKFVFVAYSFALTGCVFNETSRDANNSVVSYQSDGVLTFERSDPESGSTIVNGASVDPEFDQSTLSGILTLADSEVVEWSVGCSVTQDRRLTACRMVDIYPDVTSLRLRLLRLVEQRRVAITAERSNERPLRYFGGFIVGTRRPLDSRCAAGPLCPVIHAPGSIPPPAQPATPND